MADDFNCSFDPGSLDTITQLMGFSALLNPEITNALSQAGTMLVTTAQTNTWLVFEHPTGELAGSITFYVASPSEVDLTVGVPYGRRREYGFSGMTDSLGRYYAHDPAKPYLAPAVETDTPLVVAMLENAVYNAWGEL